MAKEKPHWYVYAFNYDSMKIESYDIFQHASFFEECKEITKKHGDNKERFIEEIHNALMYYFWSKCEWEIILKEWPPTGSDHSIKIDVFDQITANWDIFEKYIWKHRKEIK